MDYLYIEVGKILEKIQQWEKEFKDLTEYFNIKESDDKRSLSNMNKFLLSNQYINDEEYLLIKKVIEIRNYVIHRLFLEDDINKENNLKVIKEIIEESLIIFKSMYKKRPI